MAETASGHGTGPAAPTGIRQAPGALGRRRKKYPERAGGRGASSASETPASPSFQPRLGGKPKKGGLFMSMKGAVRAPQSILPNVKPPAPAPAQPVRPLGHEPSGLGPSSVTQRLLSPATPVSAATPMMLM